MSKRLQIELGMSVRKVKYLVVEVPDDFNEWSENDKLQAARNIYEWDEGDYFEEGKDDWGCEEATHYWIRETPDCPDIRLKDKNTIEDVEYQDPFEEKVGSVAE